MKIEVEGVVQSRLTGDEKDHVCSIWYDTGGAKAKGEVIAVTLNDQKIANLEFNDEDGQKTKTVSCGKGTLKCVCIVFDKVIGPTKGKIIVTKGGQVVVDRDYSTTDLNEVKSDSWTL